MDADLQHHAAGHPGGLIAPGRKIDLAQPVAADIGLGIDELAEETSIDLLLYPAKVAFAPPLIAERQYHASGSAGLGDGAAVDDAVGDRFVEEDVLARCCGGTRGRPMCLVRRGVDDGFDLGVGQHRVVACHRPAAVLAGEALPFFRGSRIARDDLELTGAPRGVGQNARPPADANRGDPQRALLHDLTAALRPSGRPLGRTRGLPHFQLAPMASTLALAMRTSVSQSPPLTPTPPRHWPSTKTGTPPSIAVQRCDPAARASPSAWATSRS